MLELLRRYLGVTLGFGFVGSFPRIATNVASSSSSTTAALPTAPFNSNNPALVFSWFRTNVLFRSSEGMASDYPPWTDRELELKQIATQLYRNYVCFQVLNVMFSLHLFGLKSRFHTADVRQFHCSRTHYVSL